MNDIKFLFENIHNPEFVERYRKGDFKAKLTVKFHAAIHAFMFFVVLIVIDFIIGLVS